MLLEVYQGFAYKVCIAIALYATIRQNRWLYIHDFVSVSLKSPVQTPVFLYVAKEVISNIDIILVLKLLPEPAIVNSPTHIHCR